MAVISFRFRVSIRSEKYNNHNTVRLHRSEFETTLNLRKTGISATSHSDPAPNAGHGNAGHGNDRVWKAWKAIKPAFHPSHTLWKSLQDSHITTASTTG
jgi:hypothetical protein